MTTDQTDKIIGQVIDKYRIVRKIGDGGMGSVFEAVHEAIGRKAAVKILRPMYTGEPLLVKRFFNEARAVNLVTHPGIVGSFDYGQLDDGSAYIVMEYVEGETLGKRLARTPRLGQDALRIGRQIAAALSAAHDKGIVHRDLKPDNVIIVPDGEAEGGERARVLDFGIAKIAAEALSGSHPNHQSVHAATQTGVVMGTPRYMAPEQCKGVAGVDAKADVYSLGVVLYEMLAGRVPFIGEGPGALIGMHIYKEPPPLRELAPEVPAEVAGLVHQLLAKEPEGRPNMIQVVRELERLGVRATGAQQMPSLRSTRGGIDPQGPQGPQAGPSAQQPGSWSAPPAPAPAGTAGTHDPSRPSLVGMASGQQMERPPSRLSRLLLPGILLCTVLVGVTILAVVQGPGRRRPSAVPPPVSQGQPAPQVVWAIRSEPAGALVVRVEDGGVLGVTPWLSQREPAAGAANLVLRLAGFKEEPLTLDQASGAQRLIKLTPLAPAAAALPPSSAPPSSIAPPPAASATASDAPAPQHPRPGPHQARPRPVEPRTSPDDIVRPVGSAPPKPVKEPVNDDFPVEPVR